MRKGGVFTEYGTGCHPSPPDKRDYPAKAFLPAAEVFPGEYRLPFSAPILNQGASLMCVDHACRSMKELQEWVERGAYQAFGNGYVYGRSRLLPDAYQGEGMYPRDAMDVLRNYGDPPADVFNLKGTASECKAAVSARLAELDKAAAPQKIFSYVRCFSPADVQGMLYHNRSPVLLATVITSTFMYFTLKDGIVKDQPASAFEDGSAQNMGGHAMLIIGWRTIGGRLYWAVQNSWGAGWGDGGLCYLPADYPGIFELWGATDAHPQGPRIHIPIGKPELQIVSGDQVETIPLDVGAQIIDGRTLIPVRAFVNVVAKLLGRPLPVLPKMGPDGKTGSVDIVLVDQEQTQAAMGATTPRLQTAPDHRRTED